MTLSAALAVFPALADSIKIGWTGPLTGNSAVLGVDSLPAVQIAVDEVNTKGGIQGRKVELLAEDDQYDTAKAVSAYSKLAAQGVVAIITSTYGAVFATAQRAVHDDIVIIDPLDCNNDIAALPENTFCLATESESVGRAIFQDISNKKLQAVLVIYDEKNPFMVLVQEVLSGALDPEVKPRFVGIDQDRADFKTVLASAKAKELAAIVFLGHDPMGQAMREARALGIKAQFYTVGTITSPGFQKLAGEAAKGALVAYWQAPPSAALERFLERFKAKTGRQPALELASIPSYDAAAVLLAAMQKSPLVNGRLPVGALKRHLYAMTDYQGLSGTITVDSDGAVRTIQETIYRFEAGRLTKQ